MILLPNIKYITIFPILLLCLISQSSTKLNIQFPYFASELSTFSNLSIFSHCKSYTSTNFDQVLMHLRRKECIWSKLWKEISHMNKSDICTIISILYPTIYKGRSGSYRNYFYSTEKVSNFDSIFFESEKFLNWPDESYSRMISKNLSNNKRNFLMGQKYIQHEIWRRQHPISCDNVIFCLIQSRPTGFGCDLHSYAISMGYCMSQPNTVFDFVPEERDVWTKGTYCKKSKKLDCFFEPLTNCSVPKSHEERERRSFKRRRFQGFVMPQFVDDILKKSLIPEEYYEWYWITAASTYLMRLNEKTTNYLDLFEKKNLVNPKPFYDLGIHVRHGDKYKEMRLVKAKNYMPAIEIYKKITGKNLKDINVFVSTEDPDVINWFVNQSGCSISYINYQRNNPDQRNMIKMGDSLALISFANLRLSLRTNVRVDTMASNWNRLIFELMQTYAENSDAMMFEMGIMRSLSAEHYKLLKQWKIAEKWDFLPNKRYIYEPDDP